MSEEKKEPQSAQDLWLMMQTSGVVCDSYNNVSYEWNEVGDKCSSHVSVCPSQYKDLIVVRHTDMYVREIISGMYSCSSSGKSAGSENYTFEEFKQLPLYNKFIERHKQGCFDFEVLAKNYTEAEDEHYYFECNVFEPHIDWLGNHLIDGKPHGFAFNVDKLYGEIRITYGKNTYEFDMKDIDKIFGLYEFVENNKNINFDGENISVCVSNSTKIGE